MHFFTVAVQKNPFFADILGPIEANPKSAAVFPQ